MLPAACDIQSNIKIPGMRSIALNLNSALYTSRHISQIQMSVPVIEVAHFPFRKQMIQIPDCRKPYCAEELNGSMA